MKVHKRKRILIFSTWASITFGEEWDTAWLKVTDNWSKVTCKRCLAKRVK
jgi:hypothetical protein